MSIAAKRPVIHFTENQMDALKAFQKSLIGKK
jgi:hypothetical protein